MPAREPVLPADHVESRILLIRGKKVMLDRDLAELYGVTTTRLNEQVQRNLDRFPPDFMFQLTKDETICLSSQFATSGHAGLGGQRMSAKEPALPVDHGSTLPHLQ
ncbi:MAG: ORF6N domain-containing protein [Candidatus Eisenbacteria sp.]|nr:ORF6N domain-containing protein [Candidatus Eisenbacteria bacterium]